MTSRWLVLFSTQSSPKFYNPLCHSKQPDMRSTVRNHRVLSTVVYTACVSLLVRNTATPGITKLRALSFIDMGMTGAYNELI